MRNLLPREVVSTYEKCVISLWSPSRCSFVLGSKGVDVNSLLFTHGGLSSDHFVSISVCCPNGVKSTDIPSSSLILSSVISALLRSPSSEGVVFFGEDR